MVSFRQVPKPAVTDRATAAALIAAFASLRVLASYTSWRAAADALNTRIEGISFQMTEDGDPTANAPEEWMSPIRTSVRTVAAAGAKGVSPRATSTIGVAVTRLRNG